MSGGEWDYKQWWIGQIANRIEHINPVLAEQMHDLHKLIDRYDYYICGDIGEDSIQKAWTEYRTKWINVDTEHVETLMFEKCLELVNSVVTGHTTER